MTTPSPADGLRECLALRQAGKEAAFVVSCADLVATHGPALLAALRLREGCEGLVARTRAEASADMLACLDDAGGYKSPSHRAAWNFAYGRAKTADDLARILEEGE